MRRQAERNFKRYSETFRLEVVKKIESGKLTIPQARRVYDITGGETIERWLKKYGKDHLINRAVYVKMKDESDKIKQLEKEKQALESALAQSHLKITALESMIEAAESHYKFDIKKTVVQKRRMDHQKNEINPREYRYW